MENLEMGIAPEIANVETIVPAFMLPILAQREAEDAKNTEILAGLDADLMAANEAYFAVMTAHKFNHHAQEVKDAFAVTVAKDGAIQEFNKKLTSLEAERSANDLLNIARYDLADKFNISLELLDKLVADSKDVKNTLKSSFTALFGKPTIFAKAGATGKDVSKSNGTATPTPTSTDVPRGTDGNPEKVGSARHKILNDLLAGFTVAQLLEKYPTDGNPAKLNGTARTVASDYGYIKQPDGTYAVKA